MVKQSDVSTYTYEATPEMMTMKDEVPPVHKDFKATLKLKDGREIKAPKTWRLKIWTWWYKARKDEIETSVLLQVSRQLQGRE